MLINSIRLYERILQGLASEDPEVVGYAEGCLSFLVLHLRQRQLVLPPRVAAMLERLPQDTP